MNPEKKTAKIVGVLIILALASSMTSGFFLVSLDTESQTTLKVLDAVSTNETQVLIGVLLLLSLTVSVVCIPIVMFPIFKQHNESLALGYVGTRIFEGFSDFILAISPLLLVTLSREYINAGAPVASFFPNCRRFITRIK